MLYTFIYKFKCCISIHTYFIQCNISIFYRFIYNFMCFHKEINTYWNWVLENSYLFIYSIKKAGRLKLQTCDRHGRSSRKGVLHTAVRISSVALGSTHRAQEHVGGQQPGGESTQQTRRTVSTGRRQRAHCPPPAARQALYFPLG